jgi:hypothetical protein
MSSSSLPGTAIVIGNRRCSHHRPQISLSLHTWRNCPTTSLNNRSA